MVVGVSVRSSESLGGCRRHIGVDVAVTSSVASVMSAVKSHRKPDSSPSCSWWVTVKSATASSEVAQPMHIQLLHSFERACHSLVARVSTALLACLSATVLKSLYMCSIIMCAPVASIPDIMRIAST